MTQDQYKILFRHVFNWPNRKMCIKEWNRLYFGTSFYAEGLEHINTFFNAVLRSEFNRLRNPNEQLYPTTVSGAAPYKEPIDNILYVVACGIKNGADTDIDNSSLRHPTER